MISGLDETYIPFTDRTCMPGPGRSSGSPFRLFSLVFRLRVLSPRQTRPWKAVAMVIPRKFPSRIICHLFSVHTWTSFRGFPPILLFGEKFHVLPRWRSSYAGVFSVLIFSNHGDTLEFDLKSLIVAELPNIEPSIIDASVAWSII